MDLLAGAGVSVAYCPRASDYFRHSNHPYRDMMARGINVCLGTDSILCHGDLSILEEMRFLRLQDGIDTPTLLKMATTCGMKALGLMPVDATFNPGAAPGLIGLRYDGPERPEALDLLLAGPNSFEVQVFEAAGPAHPLSEQESSA